MIRSLYYFPLGPWGTFLVLLTLVSWGLSCKSTKSASDKSTVESRLESLEGKEVDPKLESKFVEANTLFIRGEYDEARLLCEEILEANPTVAAADFLLGRIARLREDKEAAESYLKNAVAFEPENYWYKKELADFYESTGQLDRAATVLSEALDQHPDKSGDRMYLSELYARQRKYGLSLKQLDIVEAQQGVTLQTSLLKYQLHRTRKDFPAALDVSRQLVQMYPEEPNYYRLEAEALQALNRNAEAKRVLQEALEVEPEYGYALISLAEYFRTQGKTDSSDLYLDRAFASESLEVEGKVDLLRGMLNAGGDDPEMNRRTTRLLSILMETHPGNPDVMALQGDLMIGSADPDSARAYYRRALQEKPSEIEIWERLLLISAQQSDFQTLYEDAGDALEYYPNQDNFLFFYGLAAGYKGNYRRGKWALEKILDRNQAEPELLAQSWSELARIQNLDGDPQGADESYQKALLLFPDDPYLLNARAWFLAERGEQLDEAMKLVDRALKKDPQNPAIIDTKGWIYYQQADYSKAEEWLKKAAEKSTSPEVFEHYGDVLWKLGRTEEARQWWQKAIDAGAEDIDLSAKMNGQ